MDAQEFTQQRIERNKGYGYVFNPTDIEVSIKYEGKTYTAPVHQHIELPLPVADLISKRILDKQLLAIGKYVPPHKQEELLKKIRYYEQ